MLFVKNLKYITFSHLLILTTILPNNYYGQDDRTFLQTYPEKMSLTTPQHKIYCTTTLCNLIAK